MKTRTEIQGRISALRQIMREKGLAAFIVPSTDPHAGEYVPEHWECRKWISGFTGSAGTVVITLTDAGLWTDSRYFIQAEEQLEGTGIQLFKDRLPETPSIPAWLGTVLKTNDKVGINGWVNTHQEAEALRCQLSKYNIELITLTDDFFDKIWEDRPCLPKSPIFILDEERTGVSCSEKISRIRTTLDKQHIGGIILSS